jgi:hypothetical protein
VEAHPLAAKQVPHVSAEEVERDHVGTQVHQVAVAEGGGQRGPHPPRPQAFNAHSGVRVHLRTHENGMQPQLEGGSWLGRDSAAGRGRPCHKSTTGWSCNGSCIT